MAQTGGNLTWDTLLLNFKKGARDFLKQQVKPLKVKGDVHTMWTVRIQFISFSVLCVLMWCDVVTTFEADYFLIMACPKVVLED